MGNQRPDERLNRNAIVDDASRLVDYGDIVIHVFYPTVRDFYDLESLWSDMRTDDVFEVDVRRMQGIFSGRKRPLALLDNTPLARLLDWVAAWVERGGRSLGKPTHFQVRDGKF
mgnify:CR=1 FL=1